MTTARHSPNPSQWHSAADVRTVCAPACAPSNALVRHPVPTLRHITHPKSLREVCGYGGSQTAFAHALTQAERALFPNQKIKPWERSRVSHAENGAATPRYQADCLALLEQTVQRFHPALLVRGNFDNPTHWQFAAFKVCATSGCGREFQLHRLSDKFCPECRT